MLALVPRALRRFFIFGSRPNAVEEFAKEGQGQAKEVLH
jgi:hypothetical protein